MENEVEIWKKHPDIPGIEVSTLGRVRSVKGHYYASHLNSKGYFTVGFRVNGKVVNKLVHRLVAETFIPNPDNLAYVHHKDDNKTNNNASNLELYDASSSNQNRRVSIQPVFAINLATLETSKFPSQNKAGKALGINRINIIHVINGRQKKSHGYLFVTTDNTAVDVAKRKLHELGKTNLIAADTASAEFVSLVNAK